MSLDSDRSKKISLNQFEPLDEGNYQEWQTGSSGSWRSWSWRNKFDPIRIAVHVNGKKSTSPPSRRRYCWSAVTWPDWVTAKREWKQQGDKSAATYNLTNSQAQEVWMVASKDQDKSDTIYFDTACYNHTEQTAFISIRQKDQMDRRHHLLRHSLL
jgi:hypothetical protein